MGRRPLLRRLAVAGPSLCRPRANSQTLYAVLALLSERYPPTKGRLSTCYAPVRHFPGIAPLLVRLACVKRAANVRSEPGSNSPVIETVERRFSGCRSG